MKPHLIALTLGAVTLSGCTPTQEAPPAPAGLAGTAWQLVEFQSMDDAQGITRPANPTRYTIRFSADGRVAARLDCNRGMGNWTSEGAGALRIGPLATTRMLCPPPSDGDRLGKQLDYVRSYLIRDGRLHMSLMADGGILVWERADAAE